MDECPLPRHHRCRVLSPLPHRPLHQEEANLTHLLPTDYCIIWNHMSIIFKTINIILQHPSHFSFPASFASSIVSTAFSSITSSAFFMISVLMLSLQLHWFLADCGVIF